MTETELRGTIFLVLGQIAPEADPSALRPDENIRETLDIDSYDFLNLLIGISEELGVEIPETDYEQVFTLAGLIHYLSARLG